MSSKGLAPIVTLLIALVAPCLAHDWSYDYNYDNWANDYDYNEFVARVFPDLDYNDYNYIDKDYDYVAEDKNDLSGYRRALGPGFYVDPNRPRQSTYQSLWWRNRRWRSIQRWSEEWVLGCVIPLLGCSRPQEQVHATYYPLFDYPCK